MGEPVGAVVMVPKVRLSRAMPVPLPNAEPVVGAPVLVVGKLKRAE